MIYRVTYIDDLALRTPKSADVDVPSLTLKDLTNYREVGTIQAAILGLHPNWQIWEMKVVGPSPQSPPIRPGGNGNANPPIVADVSMSPMLILAGLGLLYFLFKR